MRKNSLIGRILTPILIVASLSAVSCTTEEQARKNLPKFSSPPTPTPVPIAPNQGDIYTQKYFRVAKDTNLREVAQTLYGNNKFNTFMLYSDNQEVIDDPCNIPLGTLLRVDTTFVKPEQLPKLQSVSIGIQP